MDKVKIFCDHSLTLREMTENLLTNGHFRTQPPLPPLGLVHFWPPESVDFPPVLINPYWAAHNCTWGFSAALIYDRDWS